MHFALRVKPHNGRAGDVAQGLPDLEELAKRAGVDARTIVRFFGKGEMKLLAKARIEEALKAMGHPTARPHASSDPSPTPPKSTPSKST
jgi:hypothetical protein